MRRALPLLALALLLLGPLPAEAAHPEDRDPFQEVLDGAPFHVAINSTGSARATMRGEQETPTPSGYHWRESQFSWTYDFHLTGVVTFRLVDGALIGVGESRSTYQAVRFLRLESEGVQDGERRTYDLREEYCEGRRDHSWLADPLPFTATGSLDTERRLVRFTAHSLGTMWPEPSEWRPCLVTTRSEHRGTPPHYAEREGDPPIPLGASVLVAEQLAANRSGSDLDLEVAFDEPKQVLVRSLEADLPTSPQTDWTDLLCGRPIDHRINPGSCEASGTVELRLVVSPCDWRKERYARHAAELESLAPPPADADLATMISYGQTLRAAKERLLEDARALAIVCVEEPPGLDELLRSRMVAHRDALVAFVQAQGSEPRALRELQRAERDLVLVGEAPHPASAELLDDLWPASPSAGTLVAQVHSPVGLHAYAPDGRHVGWNATANASESQVDGATYEGAPGGFQRLTLPGGAWKIVVDEMARGHYRLDVEWEGQALQGSEEHFARSEAGRTTSMNYVLEADDGRASLQTSPARRTAAPATFAFVEDAPSLLAGSRPADAGAQTPAPETGAAPTGDTRGTAAPAPVLVVVGATFAALLWRRA